MAMWHLAGTAKEGGVPTDMRRAILLTIHGGKIVWGREYLTKDDALAAITNEA